MTGQQQPRPGKAKGHIHTDHASPACELNAQMQCQVNTERDTRDPDSGTHPYPGSAHHHRLTITEATTPALYPRVRSLAWVGSHSKAQDGY